VGAQCERPTSAPPKSLRAYRCKGAGKSTRKGANPSRTGQTFGLGRRRSKSETVEREGQATLETGVTLPNEQRSAARPSEHDIDDEKLARPSDAGEAAIGGAELSEDGDSA